MKRSKRLTIPLAAARMLLATLLLTMTAQTAWAEITGDGSAENPYTINTATDWETFAQRVTNGETFEGKYVQLGDNFENRTSPITKTAGYEDKDFKGTFDGRGRTIWVNLSANSTSDGQNVGLFGSINGATIQDVKVEGNITSNNYSLGTFAGRVGGTSTIKHCWSNATIISTKTADTDCGAMVGFIKDGTLNIIDCAFTGSIALNDNGYEGGGFAGWISITNSNPTQISNCLFAPSSLTAEQDSNNKGYVFVSGSTRATLTNCYYNSVAKSSNLNKEGNDASGMTNEALLAALGSGWEVIDNNVVPITSANHLYTATITGVNSRYFYNGSAYSITPVVTDAQGNTLILGTDYTATLGSANVGSFPFTVTNEGDYTLTVTGIGSYRGTQTISFSVSDWPDGLFIDNEIPKGTVGHYYVNMPKTGTTTVTLPDGFTSSFKVYDDGGKSGYYSSDCNGYLVMTAPEGYIIMLEGTVTNSRKDYAKFNVYDGEYYGSGDPSILGANYGSANEAGGIVSPLLSTGRSMTLYFWSKSLRDEGLDLTVTFFKPNTVYNVNCPTASDGSITASPTSAKALSEITLTANPDDGYLLSGINVVARGISVDVDWNIFTKTAKFTMPPSDVTVTPTFTNDLANLSINMPTRGSKSVCVPASIPSLKVYDDGGPSGDYTCENCDGTLTLTVPSGYRLQMTGTVVTYNEGTTKYDYLEVYDGEDRNAALLGNGKYGDRSGENIGTLTSSGQSMTLRFYAESNRLLSGLDLTVTLVKIIEYDINLAENVTGGSVGSDVVSAEQGTTVTLTATPNEGYLLDGISVVDGNGVSVALNHDVAWYTGRNTATFTMPSSAVTVTPTFVSANDNLFLNMPKTGSASAEIPIAANFVKVYDDGGVSGDYSNNCNGTLTLTAPENCVLQLTGNIKILSSDYLSIYDGSDTNATPLLLEKRSDVVGSVVQTTDLGIITSSSRSMTLHFRSDNTNVATGLDLSVKAISQNADFGITITDAQNGVVTVEGNATTAKVNDEITLTATPEVGYALGGLSVVDGSNTAIATEWNVFENTAKFVMPGSAVTVTPVFVSTNPLSINIPAVGTVRATIPAGITSLKVYDNGGEGAAYTGCDGSLILTAPEGHWLEVKGSIEAENDDWLKVYTGTEMNSSNYLFELSGPNTNEPREITSHICDGRTVLLNFASSSNPNNYAGLDLTVSLTGSIENTGTSNTITLTQDNYQGTTATLDGASEGGFSITGDMPVGKVILSRTFESGKKTTVCWPFAVSDTDADALGKFYQFKSINGEGKIEMEQVTTGLEANKPYIFEPKSNPTLIDFGAKTLKAGGPQSVGSGFTFKGIYGLVKWTTDTSDPLYDATLAGELGKAYGFALKHVTVGTTEYQKGQFVKLGSGAYGRAFRAYLLSDGAWDGQQPAVGAARTRSAASSLPDVIDIVWLPAQGGTTGISTVGAASETDGWYSLDGRKLDGKPTKEGLYINNGKKVVIK